MHVPVSLSLSFSLHLHLQKRFGSRSDPKGIQERMFRQFKKICACDRKYAKCRTKADAHDKMAFQYISISVYIVRSHARIQRGTGGPDLLAILDRIPLNSQTNQASIQRSRPSSARQRNAIKRRFAGGPMMARF